MNLKGTFAQIQTILFFAWLWILSGCSIYKIDVVNLEKAELEQSKSVSLKIAQSSSGVSFNEGSSVILILSLSEAREKETNAVLEIVAEGDADITSVFSQNRFTFSIPSGETTGNVIIATVHNPIFTGSQAFNFSLSTEDSEVKVSESKIQVEVLDLEAAPVIQLAAVSQNITESTVNGTIGITMNVASKYPLSVTYTFSSASATDPADYAAASGTVIIAAGETSKTIPFTIASDTAPEGTETFTMTLDSVGGNASLGASLIHTVSIVDDDSATLSLNAVSGNEGSPLTFTVTLNPASTQTVTVNYATSNVTASAGTHYTAASGTLTFNPGDTSKTVNVNATTNAAEVCAANRTFNLDLSGAVSAVIGTASAVGTIIDPDVPSLSLGAGSGTEGGNVSFTASLSQACSTKNVTFNWATSSGTAISGTDFGAVNTAGTITAGNLTTTLDVATIQNSQYEGNKTFTVTLSSLVNASSGTLTNTGTLSDDELPLGAFAISGITAVSVDAIDDAYLSNATTPVVSWGASTNATSYDVTIYANDGTTVVCATQNTASLSLDLGVGCVLTLKTNYKAKVISKLGVQTLDASNSLFAFYVNSSPYLGAVGSNGPWYVMQNSSITIQALYAAAPAVGVATDDESDVMTFTAVGSASYGTITNNSSNIVYTAGVSSSGRDTFTFTITDSKGGTFSSTMTIHVVTTYTWTGVASNTWTNSTNGNWCGTINTNKTGCLGTTGVPSAGHTAIIDDTCISSNCSPTTNYNVSIASLKITGGSLTQGTGNTITLSSGYTQTAGTFTGGTNTISIAGTSSISGGTFTSGSGNVNFSGPFTLSGGSFTETSATMTVSGASFTIQNSPTYTTNSGTLKLSRSAGTITITPGSINYGNVEITGFSADHDLNAGTMNILGTLWLRDTYNNHCAYAVNNGTLVAKGNVNITNYGYCGTGTLKIAGNTNQTIDASTASTGNAPSIEIASTGGTVYFIGTVRQNRNFTYTSGNVDWGTSTLRFAPTNFTATIVPGSLTYGNISFSGWAASFLLSGQTMKVGGLLTLADTYNNNTNGGIYNGTIEAYGDIDVGSNGYRGGNLKIVGSGTQTITGTDTSSYLLNNFEIASAGTVNFAGTVAFNSTTYSSVTYPVSFTHTSGAVNTGTSSIIMTSNLSSTTVNPGLVSFYNLTFNGSSSVTINSSLTTTGTITLAGGGTCCIPFIGSSLEVQGNFVSNGAYFVNNNVNFTGSSNTTISLPGNHPRGTITINKPGASLTLLSNWTLGIASQDLILQAGTIEMGGFSLTVSNSSGVDNVLTIESGTTINRTGGTLTYESLVNNGGTIN